MARTPRCNNVLVALAVCVNGIGYGQESQISKPTVRHHPAAVQETSPASAILDQAEGLLAKGDFSAALPLLQQATTKDPKSYQAWYDLGYVQQAQHNDNDAIAAYRKSVDINSKIFETNFNLGKLLASVGQRDEALKYLRAATELTPSTHPQESKQRAWLAFGQLEADRDPSRAERAFQQAATAVPADPQPHLLLAELYQSSGKLDQAKTEYQEVLKKSQTEAGVEALRGLVNIAISAKNYAEAESEVRQYLTSAPVDTQAHLLLGRLLAAEGKKEEALAELNQSGNDSDAHVLRQKAALLTALHRENEAAPIYKALIEQSSNDAQLRYEYGLALMHDQQFPAAQEQLLAAVKLNPNLANVYGDLAVAASVNQQYDLALKALEVRTKLLGDNPGTYFLRATALDHLRRYPEATQNYRQFLAVANGKYPDEEWKARHRLLAIQNLK